MLGKKRSPADTLLGGYGNSQSLTSIQDPSIYQRQYLDALSQSAVPVPKYKSHAVKPDDLVITKVANGYKVTLITNGDPAEYFASDVESIGNIVKQAMVEAKLGMQT